MADHREPPLVPDRDFTRAGEFELDSAVVTFGNRLRSRRQQTYVLYYAGRGNRCPRPTPVGVSSPAQVVYSDEVEPFSVVAYIQNTVAPAMSVRARLNLPPALRIAGERPIDVYIGKLDPGEEPVTLAG